ncbi:hypothetical protein C8F04DRAFT_1266106 [Mycena alexandri]|uniref:Uncharacterized protein n=1 Tax=Mycena alexandri TaxID=1745969 RepID=A0AAD6SIP8_9AGAR|nr:hypothetical protein C8F04DRAFT_1266106 [Mycena alexandri]
MSTLVLRLLPYLPPVHIHVHDALHHPSAETLNCEDLKVVPLPPPRAAATVEHGLWRVIRRIHRLLVSISTTRVLGGGSSLSTYVCPPLPHSISSGSSPLAFWTRYTANPPPVNKSKSKSNPNKRDNDDEDEIHAEKVPMQRKAAPKKRKRASEPGPGKEKAKPKAKAVSKRRKSMESQSTTLV